jgi:hypothetical protein
LHGRVHNLSRAISLAVALLGTGWAYAESRLLPGEAISHVGERAQVCGTVASAKFAQQTRGSPTFLNLDYAYPKQVFTVLIWGTSRPQFSSPPESLLGERICVLGVIERYRGKAEIVVSEPEHIRKETDK